MALSFPDLTTLDADLVTQQREEAAARLQEAFPDLDLKRGVYHDTVLYFHALLSGALQTLLDQYLASRSLLDIQANPELADADTVNGVLSNWGLARQSGAQATGTIAIILADAVNVTVAAGAIFQAEGLRFVTQQVFAAKTNAALVTADTDRLITPTADGYYSFTIEITAEAAGSAYNLAKDTHVVPLSQPTGFVAAHAVSDFTGGSDTETNTEMLGRLQQGIAAKGFGSTPTNMDALLRDIEGYRTIPYTSVVGMGDPEMLRDQHSLFPISYGGRIDWYVRTQPLLWHVSLAKTAVLVDVDDDGFGIWQFSLGRDEVPGFYEVRNIRPAASTETSGGYTVTEDLRGLDLTGDGVLPDIRSQAEGAYTAYQTATIRFKDTDTVVVDLALGATADYAIEVVGLPLIGSLQETVASHAYRCRTADVLIKAPVPCFVNLSLTIHKRADEDDPDTAAIATALVNLVNGVRFVGRLYASQLYDVIHNYLTGYMTVGTIDLLGRLLRPDGTTTYLRSGELLEIADVPADMVTARTVQFFLDPAEVTIDLVTDIPMPR